MRTLDMLHRIEKEKVIYDIHYCRAGVGFLFYDPPKGHEHEADDPTKNWRQYLKVDRYYETFEQAVRGEFERLES